jgi:hypothetical protein
MAPAQAGLLGRGVRPALLALLLCGATRGCTAQRCIQAPERRELLLRTMADLAEEMAHPLWSDGAPPPPPSSNSRDGMLCERSHAACSGLLPSPLDRPSIIMRCAILAGGLRGMVEDDTSSPELVEPLTVALDANRRCAVGRFAEPTGKRRLWAPLAALPRDRR